MRCEKVESISRCRAWLQFTARWTSDSSVRVDYELVLPLDEVDCRGTFNHRGRKASPVSGRMAWLDSANNIHLPLGRTQVGTGRPEYPFNRFDDSIETPFRAGAHALWDSGKFGGLDLYYVVNGEMFRLIREKG